MDRSPSASSVAQNGLARLAEETGQTASRAASFWRIADSGARVFAFAYCAATDRLSRLRANLRNRPAIAGLAVSTTVMTVGWFFFMIAVAAERGFDAGPGYYILPLRSVALTAALLGEQQSRLQWMEVGLTVTVLRLGRGGAPAAACHCRNILRLRVPP